MFRWINFIKETYLYFVILAYLCRVAVGFNTSFDYDRNGNEKIPEMEKAAIWTWSFEVQRYFSLSSSTSKLIQTRLKTLTLQNYCLGVIDRKLIEL